MHFTETAQLMHTPFHINAVLFEIALLYLTTQDNREREEKLKFLDFFCACPILATNKKSTTQNKECFEIFLLSCLTCSNLYSFLPSNNSFPYQLGKDFYFTLKITLNALNV